MQASPFLLVPEAAALLGAKSGLEVRARLEDGRWRAIDIAAAWPHGQRDLRIYRYAVCHELMNGQGPPAAPDFEVLLPHRRPACSRDEVAIFLRCSPRHVGALAASGALAGTRPPGGTAPAIAGLIAITFRRALCAFLAEREVCA
jgi:hypothetical protein